MKHATQRNFPFDTRSVMLVAALAMGGATALQAQTPAPAPRAQATPFAVGPAATPAPSPARVAFDRADAIRKHSAA